MVSALLAHVTVTSLSQYLLVGLLGLAVGISVALLNRRDPEPAEERE